MTEQTKFIFYDLSSIYDPQFWSPNTGKIRCLLNYLGVKYELQFLKYPDIAPVLREKGVPKWSSDEMYTDYTLPAMGFVDKDGIETTVMGDFNIIEKLLQILPECYDKIYQGEEDFERNSEKYRTAVLDKMVFYLNGPFIFNAMNDDECKNFYQTTRKARNAGDMLEMQKLPTTEILLKAQEYVKELETFEKFFKFCEDEKFDLSKFKPQIDKFLANEAPFFRNNKAPTYFDFMLFGQIYWSELAIKSGCPRYDLLKNENLQNWYERMQEYNY